MYEIECAECSNKFQIKVLTKECIQYCPFCGDELALKAETPPLLRTFDEMDEYEEN